MLVPCCSCQSLLCPKCLPHPSHRAHLPPLLPQRVLPQLAACISGIDALQDAAQIVDMIVRLQGWGWLFWSARVNGALQGMAQIIDVIVSSAAARGQLLCKAVHTLIPLSGPLYPQTHHYNRRTCSGARKSGALPCWLAERHSRRRPCTAAPRALRATVPTAALPLRACHLPCAGCAPACRRSTRCSWTSATSAQFGRGRGWVGG